MCGLVGVAGNIFQNDRVAFRNLLLLDVFRGDHSTGVAVVKEDNQAFTTKQLGHPYALFESDAETFHPNGVIKEAKVKVLLGHNRYGTVGAKTVENAHPFVHGNVIGAHNGTLEWDNKNRLDDWDGFEVDSEALIYNINKNGVDKTIANTTGAWALTWWDMEHNKMFFIRNNKRPLYYTRTLDRDALYWASEEWMLEVALAKANVKHSTILSIEADQLYAIDVSDSTINFRNSELVKEREVKGFTRPITRHTVHHMGGGTNNPFGGSYSPYSNMVGGYYGGKNRPSKERAKYLEKYVGKEISFWPDYIRKGLSNVEYLSCSPVFAPDEFEIRMFTKSKFQMQKLHNTKSPLVARVKKVVYNVNARGAEEIYVTIDYRTLYEQPNFLEAKAVNDKHVVFKGFHGAQLTEEEWITRTCNGCSYCSQSVDESEANDLLWFGPADFLCPECSGNDERRKYAM